MDTSMGEEVGRKAGRQVNRLRALELDKLAAPGFYPDGAGLYLQVTSKGARSWVYRYRAGSRLRDLGLGPLRLVPLAVARAKAIDAGRLRLEGIDPIGTVKANCRGRELRIKWHHVYPKIPISMLQFIPRGDPGGGDVICPLSPLAAAG